MKLRFVVFMLLFLNNLLAMDLLPGNFLPTSESLDKFANSNPATVEGNLKDLIAVVSPQPLAKDSIKQSSLNKALAVLTILWDQRFEGPGIKLAQILVEAGADPHAQLLFTEVNCWDRPAAKSGSSKCRMSETMFQSTVYEEAHGGLKVYLQKCAANPQK